MFFDISASLYMGSAGVVILGALYWKRGTTEAAWITMITGAVLSISGFIYRQINPDFLDGRIMAFYVAIICIVTYIVASLFSRKPNKDLDKILHRDPTQKNVTLSFYQNIKNIFTAQHISKNDKFLLGMIILFLIIFLSIFVLVCVYNVYYEVPVSSWLNFWHIYIYAMFAIGSVFLTIITIGGIRDLIRLFISLKTKIVDYTDDGSVNSENLTVK
jgi:SSS family solute:Na+ symporter